MGYYINFRQLPAITNPNTKHQTFTLSPWFAAMELSDKVTKRIDILLFRLGEVRAEKTCTKCWSRGDLNLGSLYPQDS